MTLPFLIAGIILDTAGKHWFSGAATVGEILIIVGAIGIVVTLAVFGLGVWGATRR